MTTQSRSLGRILVGLAFTLGSLGVPGPAPASASTPLAVFDGFAGSHSAFVQGRANAVFALPADFFVGATFAAINSQPRAQSYGAPFGFPLARNAAGVGVPAPEYRGQCWANYPGEPADDTCGLPARELPPPPGPPEGAPFNGTLSTAQVTASGDSEAPSTTRAEGTAAWGSLHVPEVLSIGYNTSESRSFIQDGVLHAETVSRAEDIDVAGALRIGSIHAVARAVHAGHPEQAEATAWTDMHNLSIGGVPVTLGPEGLLIQDQPLGDAPQQVAKPVIEALAEHRMTIEPLAPPVHQRDDVTGLVEASTMGFRIVMFSPGDDKLEMIFGQATARAAATRGPGHEPLQNTGPAEESASAEPNVSADAAPAQEPQPARAAAPVPERRSMPKGLGALAAAAGVEPDPQWEGALSRPPAGSTVAENATPDHVAADAPPRSVEERTAVPVARTETTRDVPRDISRLYMAILAMTGAGMILGLTRNRRRGTS